MRLQLVRALIEAGDTVAATAELRGAVDDWRLPWHAGLIALAGGRPEQARIEFDAVYDALPGEPAAQLALAAASELAGDAVLAGRRYGRVWRVDHGFVSAAFGLSRMRLSAGDRAGAVAALDEVPETSSLHQAAQIAAVRAQLDAGPGPLTEADFVAASARLEQLRLDTQRQANLAVELFQIALRWIGPGVHAASAAVGRLLGQALTERELRFGLERNYRTLATLEADPRARYALIDQANRVRPWTNL